MKNNKIKMEEVSYPAELIFPNSNITIYFEERIRVNRTNTSIIIEGNRNGFLSLSHLLNVYSAYLYNPIIITDFSFVKSSLDFRILNEPELVSLSNGVVIMKNDNTYHWKISELALWEAIGVIHSLGYANNEIHFDGDLEVNEISVYCVVDES